jgi:hypothetical protein
METMSWIVPFSGNLLPLAFNPQRVKIILTVRLYEQEPHHRSRWFGWLTGCMVVAHWTYAQ